MSSRFLVTFGAPVIESSKTSISSVTGSHSDSGMILRITLDGPNNGNALSADVVEKVIAALSDDQISDASLLVIRATGKNFCTGFDLSGLEVQSDADLLLRFVRIEALLERVSTLPCFTMVFVQGRAYGAGADLVAACDIRVATDDAIFRFPGWRFGIGLGTRRLVNRVGGAAAQELLVTTNSIDAQTAKQIGLVTKIHATEDWNNLERQTALSLDRLSRRAIDDLTESTRGNTGHADADLGRLVRTASQPGLMNRIRNFLEVESLVMR